MNERIKELRVNASEWMNAQGRPLEYRSAWEKQCDEKFAELILKECIEQLDLPNSPVPIQAGLNLAKNAIKEHFGI